MATIAFQMTSTPLTGTKSFTGTDQDMTDLLAWANIAYAGIITELFNTPAVGGFTPSNAQIGVALATGTVRAWQAAVQRDKYTTTVTAVPQPARMTWA